MARQDVHFEVYLKKHKKAEWSLVEAITERQEALDLAHALKKRHPKGSVRVQREEWVTEENAFRGGTVFEAGPERFSEPEDKTGEASLPCITPDDLAGAAARETIRRVLSGWFERRQVSPLELLYRPDLIEDLDGSDTDLQGAVQKVAIARAQNTDASVHAYVRLINDLVERSVTQSRRDAKAAKNPPEAKGFAEMTEKILSEGGPEKRLRRAIADRLSKASDFGAKTEMLLDFHDDMPADPEARAFAAKQTDAFIAEMLSFDPAMRAVIGPTSDLGEEIVRLTGIYEGAPHSQDLLGAPAAARRLAEKFAAKQLPDTHIEVAKRILAALRAPKRFRPESVMREIELARKLAMRLIAASGPNLHPDSLVDAFTHRSAKLLAPEAVEEALANASDPAEQIERLFRFEDNLVGEQNKAKLAAYLRARLKSKPSESYFVRGSGQPMERLARLTAFQARSMKGGFSASDKTELADAFDSLGMAILDETKILSRLAAGERPALDRAGALLKLASQGVLPVGRCSQDAQARAMRLLAGEMGRTESSDPANKAKLQGIQQMMAGLRPKAAAAIPDRNAGVA
ncbi:MAG: hypothetical protein RKE49_07585 [Oceanicaulis sp.]